MGRSLCTFLLLTLVACGSPGARQPVAPAPVIANVAPPPPPPQTTDLDSRDILARATVTSPVLVKHVLFGWAVAKKGVRIEPLMTELSEDPGSANTGESYDVTPGAALVKPFLNLSLRLELNEVGVVKTEFGIHIIKRVE